MADRKQIKKAVLIIVGSIAGLYVVLLLYNALTLASDFGVFDKDYTTTDLLNDFNKKRAQINTVKNYFGSVVPADRIVEIEFKTDSTIARFGIYPCKTDSDQTVRFLGFDLNMHSTDVDSAMKMLEWKPQVLKTIKKKLDAANCISIKSGDPTRLGYQRSGTGMFYFNVFDRPVPDSLRTRYNDSCTYIYVNRKLILEYGGGAMGSKCFPRP